MNFKKRVNGSWVDTPHYIHNTSTDTITTPADIYANDTTATVGLKGNMEQASGVSSTTPIQPSECGDRTGNLCEINGFTSGATEQKLLQTVVLNAGTYTYSCMQNDALSSNSRNCLMIRIGQAAYTYESTLSNYHLSAGKHTMTFTVTDDNTSVELRYWINGFSNTCSFDDFMLNIGSTALPYEPYGYKLPITSTGQANNIYLGEVPTTRKIKKLVLTGEEDWQERYDGHTLSISKTSGRDTVLSTHYIPSLSASIDKTIYLNSTNVIIIFDSDYPTLEDFKAFLAAQYAAGTPVTVWYVLATSTTGVLNQPIRKIGDYADEVSGITIPTIAGANTLSVDTTLQPSEVTVTFKGWHPVADVHKRESGAWT